MYPYQAAYTPADADTDGLAAALTGAGPFTLTTTSAGDSLSHLITLTSSADLHLINMTLTGTDADGAAQTEVIAGPTSNTVTGTKYFRTVTSVAAASTLGANTMDVGWADGAVTPTFPLNWRQKTFQVSLAVILTGTISVTVQHTFVDKNQTPDFSYTWFDHVSLVNKTSSADGNYASPVANTRLKINSVTAGGTAAWSVVQGR